jgi:CRISPR-associated protein Csm1
MGELGADSKPTDLTNKRYTEDGETEEVKRELERMRGEKGRNVSIVYAGGDDLFIVGAWDEVAELSYDIQRCFEKYSGLGISGGLTLHQPKYPLYQMAKLSGEAEKEAKDFKFENESESRKNKITLFYTPFYKEKSISLNEKARSDIQKSQYNYMNKLIYALNWKDRTSQDIVENIIFFSGKKETSLELKYLSRSLLYKLFHLAEVWWERNTLYVPEFIYIMGRIMKKHSDEGYKAKVQELQHQIIKMPVTNNRHNTIRFIKIPITWIDLLLRNKGE